MHAVAEARLPKGRKAMTQKKSNIVGLHGSRIDDAHQFIDEKTADGATRLVVISLAEDDDSFSLRTYGTRDHRMRDLAFMGQMLLHLSIQNMDVKLVHEGDK